MNVPNARPRRILGWVALGAAFLELVGFCRYVDRVEDDWIGFALYLITIAAFLTIALGCFLQSRTAS